MKVNRNRLCVDEADEKFYRCCFTLSHEDIAKFNEGDNGPINNVINGLDNKCYGVNLQKDIQGLITSMFFIDGRKSLKGDIIDLRIDDKHYYELLLRFCVMISLEYQDVDPVNAFNTYQKKLRSLLEKDGYFTITNLDVEKYGHQEAIMFAPTKKGIIKIDFIEKVSFYRDFFQNNYNEQVSDALEYVYIMINADTSHFKIGTSKNPCYRERTLHSKEPSVRLVAKWCCSKAVEKDLHNRYKHKRLRGEWFNLSFKDLTEIEKYMNKINN